MRQGFGHQKIFQFRIACVIAGYEPDGNLALRSVAYIVGADQRESSTHLLDRFKHEISGAVAPRGDGTLLRVPSAILLPVRFAPIRFPVRNTSKWPRWWGEIRGKGIRAAGGATRAEAQ